MKTPITKGEINSVKKAIAGIRNAIDNNGGRYVPSAPQAEALKVLFSETYGSIGEGDYGRFANFLMSIDMHNFNAAHRIIAEESHLVAIEKALAIVEAV